MSYVEKWNGDLFTQSAAVYSADLNHRLLLFRQWDPTCYPVHFLMLNPSTATETENDPTVARCCERAKRWNYGGLVVTNLYSFRATDPRDLFGRANALDPYNNWFILAAAARCAQTIVGWGSHKFLAHLPHRARDVAARLDAAGIPLYALQVNADGMPGHPLYLSYDLEPQPWNVKK